MQSPSGNPPASTYDRFVWVGRMEPGRDGLLLYDLGRWGTMPNDWHFTSFGSFAEPVLNHDSLGVSPFGNSPAWCPAWVAPFTRDGVDDFLFYNQGDFSWWLGRVIEHQLTWGHVADTRGFGPIWGTCPFWQGNFTSDTRTELLFYYPGDKNWWRGSFDAGLMRWEIADNTTGFGQVWDGRPWWTGDFTGDGSTQLLFYYPGDKNWWLGQFGDDHHIHWNLAGNTSGFGQVADGRPFWTGDFTGDGSTQLLFYYPGDKNWWLGRFGDDHHIHWNLAGNTTGFGPIWPSCPFWAGRFTGGQDEMLFYYPGDKNWWLGRFDSDGHMQWTFAGNTAGFGQVWDGRPWWTAGFSGDAHTELLFYYPADQNWWLGRIEDTAALRWTTPGKGIPIRTPPPPPPPLPIPKATVPDLFGLSYDNAKRAVEASGLKFYPQYPLDFDLVHKELLYVNGQGPVKGTVVDESTNVYVFFAVRHEPPVGVASVTLVNQHIEGRAVSVHVWKGTTGQWSDLGTIDFGERVTASLDEGVLVSVVAVDSALNGCSDSNPANVNCQRYQVYLPGDAEGTDLVRSVF